MRKFLLTILIAAVAGITSSTAQIIRSHSSVSTTESKSRKGSKQGIHYQGELNFGYGLGGNTKEDGEKFDAEYSRVYLETVHGVRINPYAFAGIGVGAQYALDWEEVTLPVFAALRGYYPVTERFAPYVAVDLGYSPALTSSIGGFYAAYGLGLNFGVLNLGFGWQHQEFDEQSINSFTVKLGFKF